MKCEPSQKKKRIPADKLVSRWIKENCVALLMLKVDEEQNLVGA